MRPSDGSPAGSAPGTPAAAAGTPGDGARARLVHEAVSAALDVPPAARPALLDALCGADPSLRADAERLLRACERAGEATDFLAVPASAYAEPVVEDVEQHAEAARSARHAELPPPATLRSALAGRYVVEREIARGGMATVYLAHDERHDRPVAIKVVHPDLSPGRGAARFLREIQLAARLQHPHVVPLHDSGTAGGLLYYVMPYVAGESLRKRLTRDGPLPIADVVRLLREMADALAYAHEQGVVHRDIKPENVLLSRGHALVADFGVAKALAAAAEGSDGGDGGLTSVGLVLGTPAYMAPEQGAGDPVDHRADLYALGVVAYEVLAGATPFPGRRGRELLVAHAREYPEDIARHRPDTPEPLAALVMQLLAKPPSERPQSAEAVVAALDALATPTPTPAARSRRLRRGRAGRPRRRALAVALGGAALVAAALGGAALVASRLAPTDAALDPNRIVIFPLAPPAGGEAPVGAGEDVATLIGYALEGTAPLRWLEAADDLDAAQRADPRRVTTTERRAISRRRRAAFYIDGSLLREGDSATVILRLYSVAGDSVVAKRGASARADRVPLPELGLRAMGQLLAPLLEPGRRVDMSALGDRAPAAIAEFLQGERAYRAARFAAALDRYRAALAADSLFALAALNGAQAAAWLEQRDEAARLVRLALSRVRTLPEHRAAFARGIARYAAGEADGAVAEFRRVIAFDSLRAGAWAALGEVYRHLVPRTPDRAVDRDSIAEDAFARARRLDPTFTPALYHLAELAVGRGALARADTLAREYARAAAGSAPGGNALDLMLRCARGGAGGGTVDWARVARESRLDAMEAAVALAGRETSPACATDAFWAVLNADSASRAERWGALLALQSLLVARGREADVVRLLRSPQSAALGGENLLLLDASAGARVDDEAAAVARALGDGYASMPAGRLWLLASWAATRGRPEVVRGAARALAAKVDSTHARRDSLMAAAVAARAALAEGDTADALRRFQALTPSAPQAELVWYPWEGLGGERLALAELLAARKDWAAARSAAAQLDGTQAVVYLLYRRPALLLGARAAAALGDTRAAARYRERYARLASDTAALPWSTGAFTGPRARD